MHDLDLMLKLQLEGKHKEAKEISDKLEKFGMENMPTNNGQSKEELWIRHCFNRGWYLLQEGKYQEGCKLLDYGRHIKVYGNEPIQTSSPIFNPAKNSIVGKSIIISLEGGYGDEIIHSRFATSFKKQGAKKVYIACSLEFISIFSRIEGVDGAILKDQVHTVEHDYWVPGFSAGWIAGHEFGPDFPNKQYLTPLKESVEIWKNIIRSDKIKVGIRWAGNPKFEHQQFRKFPVEFITNLAKYSELEIYSLQRDHNIIELPAGIHDLQHFILGWEDTMAAIQNLDIVITSCTSVAHLAAAMGKKTWVLVPILPYHTWANGAPESNTSDYYESVKLFRQQKPKKWNDTFQNLYESVEKEYNLVHIDMPNQDRDFKKLNMGCGFKKIDGFLNVDKLSLVKPDKIVDLEIIPWPWKDNEFDHIVSQNVLEYIGKNNDDFLGIIKEMYRVTENGGIWEIQIPHWRCDLSKKDLNQKRVITPSMFSSFNKKILAEESKLGIVDSFFALEHNIDIEIVDVQYEFTSPVEEAIKTKKIDQIQLDHSLNHMSNISTMVKIIIQVHKPMRNNKSDIERLINQV